MKRIRFLLYLLILISSVYKVTAQKPEAPSVTLLLWTKTDRIPVCWIDPENDAINGRQIVIQAINDSWAKYIGKTFEWNDKCRSIDQVKEPEIRIFIDPNPVRSFSSIGTYSWIRSNGKWIFPDSSIDKDMVTNNPEWRTHTMYLSFGHYYFYVTDKEKALRFTAIHEFGHALGFLHEQTANNVPESCLERLEQLGSNRNERKIVEDAYGSFGIFYTDYDADSIMNYCRPDLFKDELSQRDIFAVQSIYPKSSTVENVADNNSNNTSNIFTTAVTDNNSTNKKTKINPHKTINTAIAGIDDRNFSKLSDDYYTISDRSNDKCLTVIASSSVKMLKCAKNNERQLWMFTENSSHSFLITPKIDPDKTLTISKNNIDKIISGELRTKYQEIDIVLDKNQNEASNWFRTPINENEFILQLSLGGFVLDRDTWDESGEKIILYKNWKGGNQVWRIKKSA